MVGNGMKVVLLAETEPALRNSIKRYLEKEDYEVRSYSKSKDLLRSLKLMENHVNMVLLGINIPSNLYLDVLRIIREMFYVPVILLSSVVAKEELLREIWGINSSIKTRVTDDTLKRLRKKLSKSQAKIRIDTVRGIGYVAKEI